MDNISSNYKKCV